MMEINLLPWREHLKRKQKYRQVYEACSACLCVFFIIFPAHLWLVKKIEVLQRHSAQLKLELESHQKIPEVNLSEIFDHQKKIMVYLKKIMDHLPPAVLLQRIYLEKNILKIDGLSVTVEDILKFYNQLKTQKEMPMNIYRKEDTFYFTLQSDVIFS